MHILWMVLWSGVVLAAAPDQVEVVKQDSNLIYLAIVTMVGTVLTTAISGIVAIYMAKLNGKAEDSAKQDTVIADKAEEVRKTLQVNRVATEVKLDKITTLVNGGVEKSLRVVAIALRRVATTTKQKGDEAAADAAEQALAEHIKAMIQVSAAHPEVVNAQPDHTATSVGIGQAVGEMADDLKEVGIDVKAVKKAVE